jgi:hypothetical protein
MYSPKYIFQIALKCETKKNFFWKYKKQKQSGRARFSGTGGDDHQFFLCGLRSKYLEVISILACDKLTFQTNLGSMGILVHVNPT